MIRCFKLFRLFIYSIICFKLSTADLALCLSICSYGLVACANVNINDQWQLQLSSAPVWPGHNAGQWSHEWTLSHILQMSFNIYIFIWLTQLAVLAETRKTWHFLFLNIYFSHHNLPEINITRKCIINDKIDMELFWYLYDFNSTGTG